MTAVTATWLDALFRHAWLIAGSAVLAELLGRAGAGVLPWWRGRRGHALSKWGLSVLLGLAGWGLVFLGLALAGLFSPAVLAGAALAMAATVPFDRVRLVEAARGWGATGRIPVALLAAAGGLVATGAFVREGSFDSLVYHLGVAWQYLKVHKAVLSDIHLQFQFSLPVEMTYALPLALGDDRFARTLMFIAFVAANSVFAGMKLGGGRPGAVSSASASAWSGPLLVLSAPSIAWLVTLAKNDIAASAWFVAGACLTAEGVWGLGSVLLGAAVAAKFSYAPAAVVWILFARPPHRRLLATAAGLILPGLAWWVKTWIATGTPVFPFTSVVMPSPFWGPLNEEAWTYYVRADWPADTLSAAGLPAALEVHMASEYLLALLLVPAVVLFSRRRLLVLGVGLAMLATLATGHLTRFLVPLVWWLLLEAAVAVERLPGIAGRAAAPLLAAAVLVHLVIDPWGQRPGWQQLARPPAAQWADFTTLKQTMGRLEGLAPRRLFVVGDLRSYLWPGRIVFDGAIGEMPLVRKFAHESWTADGIARKFRQTGARWMLYNYVSVEWASIRYHVFPWRDEALRRYVEYCKRYQRYEWRSESSDYLNGGFYIIELLRRPLARPATTVWFAPGTEGLYGEGILLHNGGRTMEALELYKSVWNRLPDVGTAWNLVGHEYAVLNDSVMAYKFLEPFAHQGMMDSLNIGEFAAACVRTDRLDEGGRLLAEAAKRYPGHRVVVLVNQAAWCGRMAVRALGKRQAAEMVEWLDRGDAFLAQVPPQPEGANEASRRSTMAYLLGLRGELFVIAGRREEATRLLQQALALAPDSNLAGRWRALLEVAAPRLF